MHYHTGTMTRNSPSLDAEMPVGYVEISSQDAQSLAIRTGEQVRISSRRGNITLGAVVTDRAGAGVLFIPFHFAEAAANMLTNNALDPTARIPEFKVCAVNIEKVLQ